MLEIVSSKGKFELKPGTQVPFVQDFNLHEFESVKDVKTWNWKLPKTPYNLELLGWYGLAHAPKQDDQVQVDVYLFGKLWRSGPLYLLDEDADNYDVSFAGEMGALLKLIFGLKLTDFTYPVISVIDMYQYAKFTVNDPIGDHDCVFAPVDLPTLRGDVWWPAQINSVLIDGAGNFDSFPQFWRSFDAQEWSADRIALENSPIGYLANSVIKFEGLYYTNANNVNIGRSPDSHPLEWTQLLQGNIKRYNPMVPMFYVYAILEHIANHLGIRIGGKILEDKELSRMVFFNTVCLNEWQNEEPQAVPGNTDIHYASHLPDITLREFLVEFAKLFNQRVFFRANTNLLYFEERTKILDKTPETHLRRKVVNFTTKYREQRLFSLGYRFNQSDVNYASDDWTGTLEGIDGGDGAKAITCQISTLPMRSGFTEVDIDHKEFVGDSDNSWFPGNMLRPVSSLGLNNDVPLQFLIYRDKAAYPNPLPVWGSNVPLLPHLSSDLNYLGLGTQDVHTLYWQGTGGLYETYYKRYLKALSLARPMDMDIVIDAESFNLMDPSNPQALADFVCLIEQLEFNISISDDKVIAEAQVLRL